MADEQATMESLQGRIAELEAENAGLRAQVSAHKGQATRARNEKRALQLELSPEMRRVGPLKPAKDEEEAADRRAAIEAALAGDHVEVVASDGKKEIPGLAPWRVNGDAWRRRPDGALLIEPILHDGGALDRPEVIVRGYGLLDAAGDQVAWCPLREPVRVGKGQRTRVENSIVF